MLYTYSDLLHVEFTAKIGATSTFQFCPLFTYLLTYCDALLGSRCVIYDATNTTTTIDPHSA